MNEGIVYVLTNPAMPKMVKIGKTGRGVQARLNELYTTEVPLPFECAYAARVADMDKIEKAFHNAFGPYKGPNQSKRGTMPSGMSFGHGRRRNTATVSRASAPMASWT